MAFDRIRNSQAGFSLVIALVALLFATAASVLVVQILGTNDRAKRLARIKILMTQMNSRVRQRYGHPELYNCAPIGNPVTGYNCGLLPIMTMERTIQGAVCDPAIGPPPCGISLRQIPPGVDTLTAPLSPQVRYSIVYEGSDFTIAPIVDSVFVPKEALAGQTVTCPNATDYLAGFKVDGTPECLPFPGCKLGWYFNGIVPNTNTPSCIKLNGVTDPSPDDDQIASVPGVPCPTASPIVGKIKFKTKTADEPNVSVECQEQIDVCEFAETNNMTPRPCPPP